jgi:hypothetical protein
MLDSRLTRGNRWSQHLGDNNHQHLTAQRDTSTSTPGSPTCRSTDFCPSETAPNSGLDIRQMMGIVEQDEFGLEFGI